MKVKLTCGRAGADFSQAPGDVIEVSDREATAMIESGDAVAVEDAPQPTKRGRPAKAKA